MMRTVKSSTRYANWTPHLSHLRLPVDGHQIVVEHQQETPRAMPTVGQRQAGRCDCERE